MAHCLKQLPKSAIAQNSIESTQLQQANGPERVTASGSASGNVVVRFTRPTPAETPVPRAIPPKDPRGVGGDELVGRKGLQRLSTVELIAKLKEIYAYRVSLGYSPNAVTEGSRIWIRDTCDPILGCLTHHHGGDVVAFESKWGNVSSSTFKKTKCKGTDNGTCGLSVAE